MTLSSWEEKIGNMLSGGWYVSLALSEGSTGPIDNLHSISERISLLFSIFLHYINLGIDVKAIYLK